MTYSVPLVAGGSGAQSVQLFGQIPANQILASGAYSSTFSGADVVLTWAWNEVLLGNATVPATCNGGATGTNSASAAFSFTASANVRRSGSYVTTDMNFGNVTGGIPANIDRTATLTLTCLKNTAFQVGLNNGRNNPAATSIRRMATTIGGSTYYLPYELYRDRPEPALGQYVDCRHGQRHRHRQRTAADHLRPGAAGHRPAPAGTYNDLVTVTITY